MTESAASPRGPMFSVVTCCYNQGRYLKENIESVLAQDYPAFEHIVVDDGSTDDTASVCRRFGHVKYIFQKNAGQSSALNRGFGEAKGAIIAWLNSDDYYEPGAFKKAVEGIGLMMRKYIVTGSVRRVDESGREIMALPKGPVPFYRLLLHPRIHSINGRTGMPCQPSTFFHRRMFQELGPLNASLLYAMDYDYWLRAFSRGYRFRYIPQIFSNYRFHPTSHSAQGWDAFMDEWTAVSNRHLRQLSLAKRLLSRCWWQYLKVETILAHRRAGVAGR